MFQRLTFCDLHDFYFLGRLSECQYGNQSVLDLCSSFCIVFDGLFNQFAIRLDHEKPPSLPMFAHAIRPLEEPFHLNWNLLLAYLLHVVKKKHALNCRKRFFPFTMSLALTNTNSGSPSTVLRTPANPRLATRFHKAVGFVGFFLLDLLKRRCSAVTW